MYLFLYSTIFKILIPCSIFLLEKDYRRVLSPFFASILATIYLIGMFRFEGVDIKNYRFDFNGGSEIQDFGFHILMTPFKLTGLPFEVFLLSIGLLNLFLIHQICKAQKVSFGIVLFLLMGHIIIVRDFAQLRVGLAINLILYSYYCLYGIKRYFLVIISFAIHITAGVLGYIFLAYSWFSVRSTFYALAITLCIWPIIGLNLEVLSFIDPRIGHYLSRIEEGYGAEVHSYNQFYFCLFLILLYFASNINGRYFKLSSLNIYSFSLIHAAVVFLSFSEVSIFSYRLTNVAMSLYPFFIANLIGRNNLNIYFKIFAGSCLLVMFEMRDNKYSILEKIKIGML